MAAQRFFTGKPCKRGHIAYRLASSGACCECQREANAERYRRNPAAVRARVQAHREAFPEKVVEQHRNWRAAHIEQERARDKQRFLAERDKHIARLRDWNAMNPEKAKERVARWTKANPGKVSAKGARRRAAVLQRTPSWADHDAIAGMYELAAAFRRTGMQVEVDHDIPLQGRVVSGLHVAENLQLINSTANKVKSNGFAFM